MDPVAARNLSQVLDAPWTEVVRRNMRSQGGESEGRAAAMSSLVVRMREEGQKTRGIFEQRDGDWNCKSRGCEDYMNFKRRCYCRKCGRDKNGARPQTQEQQGGERRERSLSPGTRFRIRAEERNEMPRRQPRVTVVLINLLVEGKDNVRLPEKDHFEVIKQAGLNISEVRGKFAKPGHLEVALSPGALSIPRALREHQKQVNDRITIISVRERGTNRAVLIRWQEIPFEIPDETIINYMQLFAKMENVGRSLRWEMIKEEEDSSPGGEMVGKWSGERTVRGVLKQDIGHIPTWHYVGGARLRLQVPGRRNCPRCLEPVGECKGGGIWGKCEDAKTPRGNWKEEQEKFLSKGGWDEKKQKLMEGLEQKEAEEATAGEDEEAENRRDEERAIQLEEVKEGLVQQLTPDKTCGGLLLRDFPEGTGDKSREKQECLLMIMYSCKLTPQEQDRLMTAEVKVTKRERARKGTIDVTLSLGAADGLLRKVWHQLERACAQEGAKRYQIEASSQLSPVRVKPPTLFMKARLQVREIMAEEEKRALEIREQENAKKEEAALVREASEEALVENVENSSQNSKGEGESAVVENTQPGLEKEGEVAPGEKDDSLDGEEKRQQGDHETQRIKNPVWVPPEGYSRCARGCDGCIAKCAEQGLEKCQSCHLNSVKGGKNHPCHNRKECLEPKPKAQGNVRGRSGSQKNQKKGQHLSITQSEVRGDRSPSASSVVKERVDELEAKDNKNGEEDPKTGEKRDREPGSTPEIEKKKQSKIGVFNKISKGGPGPGGITAPTGLPKPLI